MKEPIQKTKRLKNNVLNTKVRLGTYLLCLLITFVQTLVTFALWLLVGIRTALSQQNVSSYLESGHFLERHWDEAIHVLACQYIKQFLDGHFTKLLWILIAVTLLNLIFLWLASRKNAYVVAKFISARLCSAGLLMIGFPSVCLAFGLHSSVKLTNAQNTLLFSAYLKSSLFILIASGVALLALAFIFEFFASTIVKKRRDAYLNRLARQEAI